MGTGAGAVGLMLLAHGTQYQKVEATPRSVTDANDCELLAVKRGLRFAQRILPTGSTIEVFTDSDHAERNFTNLNTNYHVTVRVVKGHRYASPEQMANQTVHNMAITKMRQLRDDILRGRNNG